MKGLGPTKPPVVVSAKNIKIRPSKPRERENFFFDSGRVFTMKNLFFVEHILTKKFSRAIELLYHMTVT
jgi:hypothetical protein